MVNFAEPVFKPPVRPYLSSPLARIWLLPLTNGINKLQDVCFRCGI